MDAVVRHTEAGGTFTHFTCESSPRKAPPELGKVMPFGANDLSLFAAADAAIRASIADAPLPPRDKAPVDYSVEESIIKREGNLRLISRQTLKTSPRSRQGMRSPAAEKRWVVQARAPYILFPNAGSPPASAPGCCSAPLPFVSRNQPEETP